LEAAIGKQVMTINGQKLHGSLVDMRALLGEY